MWEESDKDTQVCKICVSCSSKECKVSKNEAETLDVR